MRTFNDVERGGQTNATLSFTPENKRNVGRCWRRCLMEIKLGSTSSNIVQYGGQTSATLIQQCWAMLHQFGRALRLTRFLPMRYDSYLDGEENHLENILVLLPFENRLCLNALGAFTDYFKHKHCERLDSLSLCIGQMVKTCTWRCLLHSEILQICIFLKYME